MCAKNAQESSASLLFCSYEGAADSPFGRSSADDIDRPNANVRRCIRIPHCPQRRSVCLGFLEAFRIFCLAAPDEMRALLEEVGV
ncbi:hypothetical protein EN932_35335, partial [Mesorhizobium sp. M7A.F.Ca.US.002.01.1.1]